MVSIKTVSGQELPISPKYLEAVAAKPVAEEKLCKVCGEEGHRVLPVTIATHLDAIYWDLLEDGFRFSFNPECPVIYFNNRKNIYFSKKDVKTRFGLKEKSPPRPICYCLQVTKEQIASEILEKGCCHSLQDIVSYTKAGTGRWCLTTNPSGKCCRDYLADIVDRYLEKVGEKTLREELENLKKRLDVEGPMQELVLSVKGMTCESCTVSVKAILEKIGGRDVDVSLEKAEARLTVPTSVPVDEVANAVEELGYSISIVRSRRI